MTYIGMQLRTYFYSCEVALTSRLQWHYLSWEYFCFAYWDTFGFTDVVLVKISTALNIVLANVRYLPTLRGS